jgi:hypothetical protein
VSDDSVSSAPLDRVWDDLTRQGYALTHEHEVGLQETFRDHFLQTYFIDSCIRSDPGDLPMDRKRARDVVRYWWRDEDLRLKEHDTISVTERADIPGRHHSRVMLLEGPQAEQVIRTFMKLVPPSRRRHTGTFGVNLFRTFTDVVSKAHRTDEEFITLYVLDRQGEGAVAKLCRPDDVTSEGQPIGQPILSHQLDPGEILIFDDKRFMHGATPLEALDSGIAMRDVLVCTLDYPSTYLSA